MELVCKKDAPQLIDRFLIVIAAEHAEELQPPQQVFAPAVVFFDEGLAREGAAVVFVIHFAVPHRQGAFVLGGLFKKAVHVADLGLGQAGEALQPPPALDPLITYAKTGSKGKIVILVPQLPVNDGQRAGRRPMRQGPAAPNGGDKLPELVRVRVEQHGVPPARVFATGVSMGGHEVYRLLVREPKLFARAVIVSAVGDAEKAGDVQSELRVYHGADDEVIALGRAKAMVDAVNAKNPGRASLVTLKGKRHRDAAEAAYTKSDCWKWLLR